MYENLNDYERGQLLPLVCDVLVQHVGEGNAISADVIRKELSGKGAICSAFALRNIIDAVRMAGTIKCLASCRKGYFVASNELEMQKFIISLQGRLSSLRALTAVMEKQKQNKFKN